jgi:hypothetical protein
LAWILRNDRVLVALVAAIAAEAWYLTEPIVVTYDSFAYLSAAKFIAGVEGGSFAYWRPPLLPLLLAATGVPTHQTFFWFLQAQLALGIACVMLMHDCLRAVSRWFGLVATCVFVATFAPFVCSKSIMAEQIYLFAWCLCISSGLTYLWTGSAWRLAQVVVALLVLAFSRAQGQYAIAAVLPVLAIGQPRRLPAIAVVLIAYASVVVCYGKLHTFIARSAAAPEKAIDVSSFGITDVTGKMLFYMVYPDIHPSVGQPAVSPENGPASRRMFEELKVYFSAPGHVPAMVAEARYREFAGRPDDFIQSMQREPDPSYWYAIWYALDDRLGAAASDALLLRVALEAVAAQPIFDGIGLWSQLLPLIRQGGQPVCVAASPFRPRMGWSGPRGGNGGERRPFGPNAAGERLECRVSRSAFTAGPGDNRGRTVRLVQPMANGFCVLPGAGRLQSGNGGCLGKSREPSYILHHCAAAGHAHDGTHGGH